MSKETAYFADGPLRGEHRVVDALSGRLELYVALPVYREAVQYGSTVNPTADPGELDGFVGVYQMTHQIGPSLGHFVFAGVKRG